MHRNTTSVLVTALCDQPGPRWRPVTLLVINDSDNEQKILTNSMGLIVVSGWIHPLCSVWVVETSVILHSAAQMLIALLTYNFCTSDLSALITWWPKKWKQCFLSHEPCVADQCHKIVYHARVLAFSCHRVVWWFAGKVCSIHIALLNVCVWVYSAVDWLQSRTHCIVGL